MQIKKFEGIEKTIQRKASWFKLNVIDRGKQLKDYIGNNDKTKIVIKLAIIGTGKAKTHSM